MTTYANYWTLPGVVATGSISQYSVVKLSTTAGAVKVGAAVTDRAIGVLQNDPAAGEAAEVAVVGICKVLAEASVAKGDHLACSSTGRAKATTTANDDVFAIALEGAGTAGYIISCLLAHSNY